MTRFITRMGDGGNYGVWNIEREQWTVLPTHTMEQAEMLASALEQGSQAKRRRTEHNVGILGLIAHQAVINALPLRVSWRLCPHCAEIILREQHRN